MTREEAAKILDEWVGIGAVGEDSHICFESDLDDVESALNTAISALREHPQWISVKDRLPENLPENAGRKVIPCLVAMASCYPKGKPIVQKRQRQLQYYGSRKEWEWSRIGSSRVTHWMPLPEPPKEEIANGD